MSETHGFSNLLAWSLQAGVLVAIAGLVAAAFRRQVPKAKLLHWQLTLAACLLLPFVRVWKQETVVLENAFVAPDSALSTAVNSLSAPARSLPWQTMLVWVLALVAIARLVLLIAGLVRMRAYRRRSTPLPPQKQWGVDAELRISADVTSPVTFGFLNPVILLPEDFTSMDEPHRDAILCHEFQHVRRHDWLFTVGEELIRAALWFHPGIWWVLSEIQLAREQVVDQEAIGITLSRDQYVDALLAVAHAATQPDLAAASPFLRRRHLKQRIVSIFQETRMSQTKAVSAFAASVILLAASCWLVTGAIPLYGAPQLVSDSPGVSVDTGSASLLHRSPVVYPIDALAKHIEGTVTVLTRLDDKGNVGDASIVSGPDPLRKAVLQSVLNWHFTSDSANSTRQIAVSFRLPVAGEVPQQPAAFTEARRAVAVVRAVPAQVTGQQPATPQTGAPAQTGTITKILIQGLADAQQSQLAALLPVHEGDPYTLDLVRKVLPVVHAFDEHLAVSVRSPSPTEFTLVITAPAFASSDFVPAPPPPPPLGPSANGTPAARVGGMVQQSKLINQTPPVYPPLAKAARVQGTIRFEVRIGTDGHVENLQLLSGPPLLVQAAMVAVQQWVYAPTFLNGNPVEVITTVDVNFTLAE